MTIIRLFLLCHWLPKSLADYRCQSNAAPIQVVVYRTGNECLEVIVKVLFDKLFEYEN